MALLTFLSLDKFLLLWQPQFFSFICLFSIWILAIYYKSFDRVISNPNLLALTCVTNQINVISNLGGFSWYFIRKFCQLNEI